MFTINIYIKFALILMFLGGGIFLAFYQTFWYSFPLLLIGISLLVSYIMLGTVQSAAQMVQNMDFHGAEKRLNLTLTPKLLYVTNRAFFYIMKGSIAANSHNSNIAETYFTTALKLKLPSDNEKAMVLMQLANINATKGKWSAAKNYFNQTKRLKVDQSQIKEQLSHLVFLLIIE